MASIPLLCNICPKRPTFSDLSHLLTHVSSKGHLSHYFKAQVRSLQESAVREQLDAYDIWYQENQVEKLLSERLMLKESKAARSRRKPEANKFFKSAKSAIDQRKSVIKQNLSTVEEQDVLDPQLSQNHHFPSKHAASIGSESSVDYVPPQRAHAPRMRVWSTGGNGGPYPEPCPSQQEHRQARNAASSTAASSPTEDVFKMDGPFLSCYPDPSDFTRSSPPALIVPKASNSDSSVNISEELVFDEQDLGVGEDQISESTKLKGICWPGMAIFDSANPDARRMRNQKKDGSILEQMQQNAAVVEPIELIFHVGGDLKKQQVITGQPNSSPIKESPKPKVRRSKPKRPALAEMSVNAPRAAKKPYVENSSARAMKTRATEVDNLSRRPSSSSNPGSMRNDVDPNQHFLPMEDEEFEWRLNAGGIGQRRNTGLFIHEDEIKNGYASSYRHDEYRKQAIYPHLQQHSYDSQRGLLSHGLPLSSSFHHSSHPLIGHSYMAPMTREARYSQEVRDMSDPLLKHDKENVEPIMNRCGRIDNNAAHRKARPMNQHSSMHAVEPPHFYHPLPSHMDFGKYPRTHTFHHTFNPLSTGSRQPPSQPIPRDSYHSFRDSKLRPPVSPRRFTPKLGKSEVEGRNSGDDLKDDSTDDGTIAFPENDE